MGLLRKFVWLSLMVCACAGAATPTYILSCVPDSTDLSLVEQIRARLDLHGWQEVAHAAHYQLCFRLGTRQQIAYPDGANPGYPYGPYWNVPPPQVVTIPFLSLSATRQDGSLWQAQQDLPAADRPAQSLEQGVRLLIDRLPLE